MMAPQTAIFVILALRSLQLHICDAQEEGAVRLVNGTTKNCGRVEVFHNNMWGTVCDDRWDYRDADVVCKQLGYERSERRYMRAHFGQGKDPIWLDNVRCHSGHSSLSECPHRGWGVHNCKHSEDAGACCRRIQAPKPQSLPVRLTCPKCKSCNECPEKLRADPTDCQTQAVVSGIVEIQVNGVWGPLTAESWTANEAEVVCGELGYPLTFLANTNGLTIDDHRIVGALSVDEYIYPLTNEYIWPESALQSTNGSIGSGNSELYLDQCTQEDSQINQKLNKSFSFTFLHELECSGREINLLGCFFSGIGSRANPTRRVAAVKCGFKPHFSCPSPERVVRQLSTQQPQPAETIRLRGGAVPWQGRIEIFKDGEWGTVCDTGFDVLDGNVVCRQLGYGSTSTIYTRGGIGRGVGKVHLAECRCGGNELRLVDCECVTGFDAQECEHRGDVGIKCHVPQKCSVIHDVWVSMFEDKDPFAWWVTYTYPELHRRNSHSGLFCYSSSAPTVTKAVGEVICRETKGYYLSRIYKKPLPIRYINDYFYKGKINCTGDEITLSECSMDVYTVTECTDEYVIVDCTNVAPDLVLDVDRIKASLQSRHYIEQLPMYYLRCAMEERCLSSSSDISTSQNSLRSLLRFDSMAWNWGTTDFNPMANRNEWQWHSCHQHFHSMEDFVHYNLINESTGMKMAEGHKASFCLEDSRCVRSYSPRYYCSLGTQGISVNCGDLYGSHLDCQWIDITGVAPGTYLLQLNANPDRLAVESDYRNNVANCRIELTAIFLNSNTMTLRVDECWLSDH